MNDYSESKRLLDSSQKPSAVVAYNEIGGSTVQSPYYNNNGVRLFDFGAIRAKASSGGLSFAWKATILAGIGSFLFGFNLALLNTSIKAIGISYKWCTPEAMVDCDTATLYAAFVSAAVFTGAAAGSMTAGKFLHLGRRTVMLISLAIFIKGITSSVLANSFSSLLWERFVVGYAVGVVSVVCPMYIAEMSPKDKRGMHGVFHQLMITLGIFIAVLIGLPFSDVPSKDDPNYLTWEQPSFDMIWWRVMLGLGLAPVCVMSFLLLFVYKFETPYYYCEKKQYEDAQNILRLIYNKDDVSAEVREIEDALNDSCQLEKEGLTFFKAITMQEYSKVIFVGCIISAFQQLSGINIFVASSNRLFRAVVPSEFVATCFSIAMTGVNVIMTLPAMYLIENIGRRTLIILGTLGQAIGVAPAAIMYCVDAGIESETTKMLAVGGSIVFIICFATAYGPVLWVYLSEIYPREIRGAGVGAATATNWICGIFMVFISNFLSNGQTYTLCAVMCVVSCAIAFTTVLETRGRSIDDSPFVVKSFKI